MTSIRGLQMLFTRVEAAYSPQRKSDFQTVYYSRELPIADVREIEKRVRCFQTNNPGLARRQFFTLGSNAVVLTHSIMIESHPQIIDRNRRGGVFLAHCLVFSKDEFLRKAYGDPFLIFDRFRFVTDPVTMVEQYNQAEGREPSGEIEIVNPFGPVGDDRWWPEAARLVGLAEQAPTLTGRGQSLLVHGPQPAIVDLLRAAIRWSPRRMRLACSFDTHVERCPATPGQYWAIGLPGRASGWSLMVDAASYRVGLSVPPLNTKDPYLAWLAQNCASGRPETATQAPVIQELGEAFNERRYPDSAVQQNEAACNAFLALNEARVLQDLRVAIEKAVGPTIGGLLADQIARAGGSKVDLLRIAATQTVPVERPEWLKWLARFARAWVRQYSPDFGGLKRNGWRGFQELAQRADDPVLLFWAAALGDERRARDEALGQMTPAEFQDALALLLRPIAAFSFIAKAHVAALVAAMRPIVQGMEGAEFVEFIRAIIAADGAPQLDGLAGRVATLDDHNLVQLERELQKTPDVAGGFRQAMAARREELGVSPEAFGPSKEDRKMENQILCPYCLTEIHYRKEFEKCPNLKCAKELPIQYIQNYDRAAPFFVQFIGWSGVGKTVYLQALTLMLMQMGKFWRNYSYSPLTEETLNYVQNVRESVAAGTLPTATQGGLQEAYIMLLLGMSRWGGRTLVSHDVMGGYFNEFQFPVEYTPYLLHVPTTFLMLSLADLKDSPAKTMDQLMTSYIQTLAKHDPNFRREQRKVVVILSKADKIIADLPPSLQDYLQTDPLLVALNSRQPVQPLNAVGMQRYMENLGRISREIQEWIGEDPLGRNLINQAKGNNIHVEFTIVSSTGADVDASSKTMGVMLQPVRVLDPYFWALDFQSEP